MYVKSHSDHFGVLHTPKEIVPTPEKVFAFEQISDNGVLITKQVVKEVDRVARLKDVMASDFCLQNQLAVGSYYNNARFQTLSSSDIDSTINNIEKLDNFLNNAQSSTSSDS